MHGAGTRGQLMGGLGITPQGSSTSIPPQIPGTPAELPKEQPREGGRGHGGDGGGHEDVPGAAPGAPRALWGGEGGWRCPPITRLPLPW